MVDVNERAYRVGMIGCGRKGTQHARAWSLAPGAEVVAGADTDTENLEMFRRRFGVPVYADYREMLRNERIDIAAPILPVRANYEVVMGCAEFDLRGILCEKPITDRLQNADEMVAACRARGNRIWMRRPRPELARLSQGKGDHRLWRDRERRCHRHVRRFWRRMGHTGIEHRAATGERCGGGVGNRMGERRPVQRSRSGTGRVYSVRKRHRSVSAHERERQERHRSALHEGLVLYRLPGISRCGSWQIRTQSPAGTTTC